MPKKKTTAKKTTRTVKKDPLAGIKHQLERFTKLRDNAPGLDSYEKANYWVNFYKEKLEKATKEDK